MTEKNESINKLVFSSAQDALSNMSMPEEALKLLMNIKEADKLIEQNLKKQQQNSIPVISKMSFNPETGFSIDPSMLAKLNLNSPQPPKQQEPIKQSINISETNQYSVTEASALVRSFNISEEGMFLGIISGTTNKAQVIEILSKYSEHKYNQDTQESILIYDDISLTIYFDDENITNQLDFGKSFRGNTNKGLRIGDTVEKAIELYGPPAMKSPKGAIWKNLKVFCTDGSITSIKIQKA